MACGSQHWDLPAPVADLWVLGGCLESSPSELSLSPSSDATETLSRFGTGSWTEPSSKDMRRATFSGCAGWPMRLTDACAWPSRRTAGGAAARWMVDAPPSGVRVAVVADRGWPAGVTFSASFRLSGVI